MNLPSAWATLTAEDTGVEYPINLSRFSIGRHATCDVALQDFGVVSGTHAVFESADRGLECYVTDFSTNGTYIGGKRLVKHRRERLFGGEQIALASANKSEHAPSVFVFKIVSQPPLVSRVVQSSTGDDSPVIGTGASPYARVSDRSRNGGAATINNNAESLAKLYRSNEELRRRLREEASEKAELAAGLELAKQEARKLRLELCEAVRERQVAVDRATSLVEAQTVDNAATNDVRRYLLAAIDELNRATAAGGDTQASPAEKDTYLSGVSDSRDAPFIGKRKRGAAAILEGSDAKRPREESPIAGEEPVDTNSQPLADICDESSASSKI